MPRLERSPKGKEGAVELREEAWLPNEEPRLYVTPGAVLPSLREMELSRKTGSSRLDVPNLTMGAVDFLERTWGRNGARGRVCVPLH